MEIHQMRWYQLFYRLGGTSLRSFVVVVVAILLAGAAEPLWTFYNMLDYDSRNKYPDNFQQNESTWVWINPGYARRSLYQQLRFQVPFYNEYQSWNWIDIDRPTVIEIRYHNADRSSTQLTTAIKNLPSRDTIRLVTIKICMDRDYPFPLADIHEIVNWKGMQGIRYWIVDRSYNNIPRLNFKGSITLNDTGDREDWEVYKKQINNWFAAEQATGGNLSVEQRREYELEAYTP